MRFLRQVVPLGELQKDGKTVLITRMFGDDIEKLFGGGATLTTVPADLEALEARVLALEILVASHTLALAAHEARLDKLEDGYQS